MTVSNEAVEAAAKGIYRSVNKAHADTKGWDEVKPNWQRSYRRDARAALEAAAPFIQAQALEDSAQDFEDNIGVSEFDELSRRDGSPWAHIAEDWDHQGPYMDWLRARAAALRGQG